MMRSATAFLPDSMITFMNLESSTEPNFGSGRMSRLGTSRRRGMTLFLRFQLAPGSDPGAAAVTGLDGSSHRTDHLLGSASTDRDAPAEAPATPRDGRSCF